MNLRSKISALTGGNKKAATFLLFVVLSAIIWTINALSKDQITTVVIPIQYLSAAGSMPEADLPQGISVTLRGKGFYLMQFLSSAKDYKIVPRSVNGVIADTVISAMDAIYPLTTGYKGKIEITSISPEQVLVTGRKLFSKKVAIKARADLSFRPSFVQKGPAVTYPDSIYIYAASPIPDTLTTVYTVNHRYRQIDQTIFRSTPIALPGREYHIPIQTCWYYLPVERGTEIQLEVPIRNPKRALNENYLPSNVQLTCKVPLSKYNITRPEYFKVIAADTSINGDQVILRVTRHPHWVSEIKIQPTIANRIIRTGYQP
jgi:hypothetical protein